MPLQDREVNIDEFIKFTAGGLKIADFDQVLAAIIKRYKQTYGEDIDLKSTTADGVFVYDVSLIVNNILQSFKILYSNLDVESASGVYLDTLCKLSNVVRKEPTNSIATLLITGTGVLENNTEFLDGAGVIWKYEGNDIQLSDTEQTSIIVKCIESGAVIAPPDWISKTFEVTDFVVSQPDAAIVGQEIETDEALRARRAQSTGAEGVTVLESLIGELLSISGIKDAYVYNNNTDTTKTAKDTTSINPHSIYVVLRYNESVIIEDSTIGTIIYEKLTPGISTNAMHEGLTNGTAKSYNYIQEVAGMKLDWIAQSVHWKKATPIHPTITMEIIPYSYFDVSTYDLIKDAMFEYLNNIQLSKVMTVNDCIINAVYADPQFKNAATYAVKSVTLPQNISNPDTYFKYTNMTHSAPNNEGIVTLTFN